MFRPLGPEDVERFKQWARDNHTGGKAPCYWHPVVQAEWNRLSRMQDAAVGPYCQVPQQG